MEDDDFPTYQEWRVDEAKVENGKVRSVLDEVKEKLKDGEDFPLYVYRWPDQDTRAAVEEILTKKGWKPEWRDNADRFGDNKYLLVNRGE